MTFNNLAYLAAAERAATMTVTRSRERTHVETLPVTLREPFTEGLRQRLSNGFGNGSRTVCLTVQWHQFAVAGGA